MLRKHARGSSTGLGTGGMVTKLQAANVARHAGCDVVIAAGSERDVITRVAAGESVGTRFPALEGPSVSRKQWILAGPRPAGAVVVDSGAASALCHGGRSLLPAGIRSVEGDFHRGDTVTVLDGERHELARGIVAYHAADLQRIAGAQSGDIEKRLGFTYGSVAIHRNDLILLTD
jgi:glutamate 5-kinase